MRGFWQSARGRKLAAKRTAVLAAASAIIVVGLAISAVAAQAGRAVSLVRVERAAPAPAGGHTLGVPSASKTQTGYVVLKPRDNSQLQKFIKSVASPHSASYHEYLKAGQFQAKFGPTQATISAVKAQLTKDGLKVGTVTRDGLMVPFTGTTAKVEAAFDTHLENFRTATGHTGQLATRAIKLPSTISSHVTAVIGLNNLIHPETAVIRPPKSAYAKYPAAKTGVIKNRPKAAANPGADTTDAQCVAADNGSAPSEAAAEYGGLTDDQVANAYGATSLYSAGDYGQGVHIGLYELEPFSISDLQSFDQCYFGDTQAATMIGNVKVNQIDGGQPSGPGSGEAILDIEDISAMAPAANIDVYEAPNTTAGGIDDYAQMVNDDTDQIISSSWGECEQDEQLYDPGAQEAENYIFEQAAAQGQTVLSAAGDTGDDTCNEVRDVPPPTDQNPLSVDDPSSQPYVVAVGGTTLQDANPSDYDETVWNDGAQWGGGGGGISQSWTMPSWQSGSQVPGISEAEPGGTDWTNANSVESGAKGLGISDQNWQTGFCQSTVAGATSTTPCRALPDISADADEFTGAITIYSTSFEDAAGDPYSGWITIGGTSSATPIWAGLLALVDESAGCSTVAPSNGHGGIGFVAPLLYAIASDPSEYAQSFHDITSGNNDVYGFDNGAAFPARTGYDMASGLGSPMLTSSSGGTGLAADLCALVTSSTARPTVTSLAPTDGTVAGGNSVTVTGTGFESGGSSDVQSVQVGGTTVTGSAITVNSNTSLTVTMPTGSLAGAPMTDPQTDINTGVTSVTGGSTQNQDGAGPVVVVVTTTAGASSAIGPDSTYSYVDDNGTPGDTIPMVSSVGPYAGLESDPGQVTVYGSGFASGDTVSFGGVDATDVDVVNSNEIKVTPPDYSGMTTCSTAAALTTETGDANPAADDICQTEVVVTNINGPSNTSTIYPTYEGTAPFTNQDGLPEVPQGYELSPQPTEYDYVPAPTITNVSTNASNNGSLASDEGGTVVKITGTGLNPQTLNWFDVGNPSKASSIDYTEPYYTGTEVELVTPATPDAIQGDPNPDAEAIPIYADTMADATAVSQSTGNSVIYAGVPYVAEVAVDATTNNEEGNVNAAFGLPVAPDNGGTSADTALTVYGAGFNDSTMLAFSDANGGYSLATQYTYNAASDNEIDGFTPSSNPAIDDVLVCTVSGCSTPSSEAQSTADEVLLYPPGAPKIDSLSVSKGPADGGQTVTISGENLGCTTSVVFGSTPALTITPTTALLDCGSTSSVTVVAPAGTLGKSVAIKLTTVETDSTGDSAATSPTDFTYTANPKFTPKSVNFGTVSPGKSSGTVTVTVTNPTSAAPLDLGTLSITGSNESDFSIVKDGCSGYTLASGAESCKVTLKFTPMKFGTRKAELQVPFDQTVNPLVVPLTGTAKTCVVVKSSKLVTRKVKVTVNGRQKLELRHVKVSSSKTVCTG